MKKTFTAIVRLQKSGLNGDFGRINSKELAAFIDKKVRVTVEEIDAEEKAQAQSEEK